jgi:hypothetical protein
MPKHSLVRRSGIITAPPIKRFDISQAAAFWLELSPIASQGYPDGEHPLVELPSESVQFCTHKQVTTDKKVRFYMYSMSGWQRRRKRIGRSLIEYSC